MQFTGMAPVTTATPTAWRCARPATAPPGLLAAAWARTLRSLRVFRLLRPEAPVRRPSAFSNVSRFFFKGVCLAAMRALGPWFAAMRVSRLYASRAAQLCRLVRSSAPWLVALAALALPVAGIAQTAPPTHDPLPMTSLLWSLRAMVGSWVVLLGVVCVLVWRGPAVQSTRGRFALWACVLTLPLPWIAMISGWLVLEIGQPAAPTAALAAAQTATDAAGNTVPAPSSTTALLGWGCAYALLMFVNLKLSLRWLRLEPVQGGVQASPMAATAKQRSGGSGTLTERLANRYRPGVGESEFDMVVEEHSRPAASSSGPAPLMLTDESSGRSFDVDQLRRAIVRLRKERNALRKVVKAKQQKRSEHGAQVAVRVATPAAPARGRPGGAGDTRMIPVLNDVVQTTRRG